MTQQDMVMLLGLLALLAALAVVLRVALSRRRAGDAASPAGNSRASGETGQHPRATGQPSAPTDSDHHATTDQVEHLKRELRRRIDEIADLKTEIQRLKKQLRTTTERPTPQPDSPRSCAVASPPPEPRPNEPPMLVVHPVSPPIAEEVPPRAGTSPSPPADEPALAAPILDDTLEPDARRALAASMGVMQTLDKLRDLLADTQGFKTSSLAEHIRSTRKVWQELRDEVLTSARERAGAGGPVPQTGFKNRILELGPLYFASIVDGIDHTVDPSRSNPEVQGLILELCGRAGLEPLPTKPGDAFDPEQHHPMRAMGQATVSAEKYRIGRVIERGFRYVPDGRVARRTKVDLQG